jgi:hypothetical protein
MWMVLNLHLMNLTMMNGIGMSGMMVILLWGRIIQGPPLNAHPGRAARTQVLTLLLVGNVGVVSGIFPPKLADTPTCWRHVADTTWTMSATWHDFCSPDTVSVSCRHADYPTCRQHVGKKAATQQSN